MEVEDEHHVLTHAPKSSHSYKNSVHGLQKITNKFTFSKIYGQETNQKEFFNGTMLGTVKNFIDGQNCLVFSYGVTSSGKTYTIQGTKWSYILLPKTKKDKFIMLVIWISNFFFLDHLTISLHSAYIMINVNFRYCNEKIMNNA